jgi:hypothetical protein
MQSACGVALGSCHRLKLVAVLAHRAFSAVGVIANLFANVLCQNRKRQAERALHRKLELLREQGHQGVSTSQKKLPHAPVVVAPKEGHAAWIIERERLSAPGDETEAKALSVFEARLLKLLDPHTERELPNAEAIVEGGLFLFIRISAEGLERVEPKACGAINLTFDLLSNGDVGV